MIGRIARVLVLACFLAPILCPRPADAQGCCGVVGPPPPPSDNTPDPPYIASLTVATGTQGTTVTTSILGSNFVGVTGVDFGAGIGASLGAVAGGGMTVVLTIRPDAAPGPRSFSVTTGAGATVSSGSVRFTVLAAPTLAPVPTPTPTPGPTPTPTPILRPVIMAPPEGSRLRLTPPTPTTFTWTAVSGAAQYAFEYTGPGRQFANPNGTGPDPVNGFGGAGGLFLLPAASFTSPLDPSVPPGTYQFRVVGLSPTGQVIGSFSDARTVLVQ